MRSQRATPPLVLVRQELGLLGDHVHPDRTLRLAASARQAEIERLFDGSAPEAAGHDLALEHLKQRPRAAPRRVLLVVGGHVGWGHRAPVCLAALPYPHAPDRRVRHAAFHVGTRNG